MVGEAKEMMGGRGVDFEGSYTPQVGFLLLVRGSWRAIGGSEQRDK